MPGTGLERQDADPSSIRLLSGLNATVLRYVRALIGRGSHSASAPSPVAERIDDPGHFEHLFDQAPVGYIETDSLGVIMRGNLAAHALLGRAPNTLAGYRMADLGWDLPDSACDATTSAPTSMDVEYRHPDGIQRELELKQKPIRSGNGRLLGLGIVLNDVTQRNFSEREREDLRTRVEQHQRLETMGTMAGGIAHDFNNLLAPILGYAEIAQMDLEEDSQLYEDLSHVRAAAARAKDLVGQMLVFSRLESAEAGLVQLQKVAEEVVGLLRASLPATVTIQNQVDASCPSVLGTSTQFHQILFNLCTNASHAMPDGGTITLTVDTMDALATSDPTMLPDGPGPYVRIRVTDDGHGIDAETLKQIWDPYFTTKEAGKGTGLGLSLVRGITTELGGTIAVRSEVGLGTSFTLLFTPHEEEEEAATSDPAGHVALSGEGNILIVDDEDAVLRVTARALSRLGYAVEAYRSSREALNAFHANPDAFDLLLTDQTMPDLTGLQLCEVVRGARPDIPIILTSGYRNAIADEDLDRLRGCEFLPKPASPTVLGLAVARGLRRA